MQGHHKARKATSAHKGHHVFRLAGSQTRQKTRSGANATRSNVFHTRRSHTKSRAGCQNCKRRRVKCDEGRNGGCMKCQSHGIECDYDYETAAATPHVRVGEVTEWTECIASDTNLVHVDDASGTTLTCRRIRPLTLYNSLNPPTAFAYDLPSNITDYGQTLCHFQTLTCPTITTPQGQSIVKTSVLAIAQQDACLMHAVLGTAAAHLAWGASSVEATRHRQAEAYHWHRAIAMFRSQLDGRGQSTQVDADVLISTCMLLGIHSYLVPRGDIYASFIWQSDGKRREALRWLKLQGGFRTLLRHLGERAGQSVWFEILRSAVPGEAGLVVGLESAEGVYRDFLELCAVTDESTCENNVYLTALQNLFALLQAGTPTMDTFAQLMAFMGRLADPLQELLVQRDPAALLIVAYWFALMHQLQLWWIHARARCECTAITLFLRHSRDECVQRLLHFPAKLMDIDLTQDCCPQSSEGAMDQPLLR